MNEHQNINDDSYPYDPENGEYFLEEPLDSYDIVYSEYVVSNEDAVNEELYSCLPDDQYIRRNWELRPPDVFLDDVWKSFKEQIMHHTRFVFWAPEPEGEEKKPSQLPEANEIEPQEILTRIASHLEELNVVTILPTEYRFWRLRPHESPDFNVKHADLPGHLGTAPIEFATKPNRMSPAGIPMFYGSLDKDTAIEEVRNYAKDTDYLTGGAFRVSGEITVLDFSKLPSGVTVFDPAFGHLRREVIFLNNFVKELSEPIAPDDRELKYVATQVITEFLLKRYLTSEGKRPYGILYKSSLSTGELSAVFDIDNAHCAYKVSAGTKKNIPFLLLDPSTVQTIAPRIKPIFHRIYKLFKALKL